MFGIRARAFFREVARRVRSATDDYLAHQFLGEGFCGDAEGKCCSCAGLHLCGECRLIGVRGVVCLSFFVCFCHYVFMYLLLFYLLFLSSFLYILIYFKKIIPYFAICL